jgi:hydroxyethylthiazole kinase-like uncharacterized protein yjeF
MQPILTPTEMAAVDGAAPESIEELIDRAGRAVARVALEMLGGSYGRVVRVIAGKGNNGNDGRVAVEVLRARGVHVEVFDAAAAPAVLPTADLVIDAAYGTGFRGAWEPPDIGASPVLAVDVPSGVDALTGAITGSVLAADRTVTFQALKPGLLFAAGARLAGIIDVVDIGLDVSAATCHRIDGADVGAWWPRRPIDAHKWQGAVRVVAGSHGMTGAAALAAEAAARAGAGLVKLSAPGLTVACRPEIVQILLAEDQDWSVEVLADADRFGSLAIGPGLGRDPRALESVRACVASAPQPVVVDGDGLYALAHAAGGAASVVNQRSHPTVLTPHDGEFRELTGALPGSDRLAATRELAAHVGCTVLLKGPATVVANPDGAALVVDHGDQRLATAGSGDVLTGIIAAALAAGLDPMRSAAAAAWLHAEAGALLPRWGMLAGDLAHTLPTALAGVLSSSWK